MTRAIALFQIVSVKSRVSLQGTVIDTAPKCAEIIFEKDGTSEVSKKVLHIPVAQGAAKLQAVKV